MTNFSTDEAAYRFARKLTKLGVDDKLREMGAKSGDIVQILDFSFDFKEKKKLFCNSFFLVVH